MPKYKVYQFDVLADDTTIYYTVDETNTRHKVSILANGERTTEELKGQSPITFDSVEAPFFVSP